MLAVTADAFGRDRLRVDLLHDAALDASAAGDGAAAQALAAMAPVEVAEGSGAVITVPLSVKGRPAGALSVRRPQRGFADRDRALLASFAAQLSIALENARLYRQLDTLFRSSCHRRWPPRCSPTPSRPAWAAPWSRSPC